MGAHSIRSYGGRTVRIHLPPGYDASRRDKFPLLLLHDGQNLFQGSSGSAGSTGSAAEEMSPVDPVEPIDPVEPREGEGEVFRPPHMWRVDEVVDRLVTARQIPAVVVAGIDHAGARRVTEFTPTPGRLPTAGKSREYARLVMNDVLPRLANDFHVRTDAAGVTLGGSSLGGLVTLWMALSHPGRFGRLIVMSPSVWWDDRVILKRLETRGLEPPPRVWLDVGKKEGPAVLRDVRALRDVLRTDSRLHLRYVEDEHGDHSESSWGRRLADALTWIYGAELPLSARLRPRSEAPARPALRRTR